MVSEKKLRSYAEVLYFEHVARREVEHRIAAKVEGRERKDQNSTFYRLVIDQRTFTSLNFGANNQKSRERFNQLMNQAINQMLKIRGSDYQGKAASNNAIVNHVISLARRVVIRKEGNVVNIANAISVKSNRSSAKEALSQLKASFARSLAKEQIRNRIQSDKIEMDKGDASGLVFYHHLVLDPKTRSLLENTGDKFSFRFNWTINEIVGLMRDTRPKMKGRLKLDEKLVDAAIGLVQSATFNQSTGNFSFRLTPGKTMTDRELVWTLNRMVSSLYVWPIDGLSTPTSFNSIPNGHFKHSRDAHNPFSNLGNWPVLPD